MRAAAGAQPGRLMQELSGKAFGGDAAGLKTALEIRVAGLQSRIVAPVPVDRRGAGGRDQLRNQIRRVPGQEHQRCAEAFQTFGQMLK
jgi:hypothetical protein